jgi:HEAT repeat protein
MSSRGCFRLMVSPSQVATAPICHVLSIALLFVAVGFGQNGPPEIIVQSGPPETIAHALKRHHIPLTRSALVAALQNSDPEVRGLAAAELAEEKASDAVPAIAKALASERVPITRVNIAFALARLGNEKGVKALESACHEPASIARVRMTAAMYMVDFLHRNACFADVLDVLDSHNDDQAGDRMQALSLAPSFKGLSEDESQRLLAATINNLQDTTASVRISASDALVRLGNASALPYLQEAVSVEQDEVVRNALEDALKRLQQQE